jgi:hypothetical protein
MDPISWPTRFAQGILVLWKRCLSYRKRDWELADYPVVFRTQEQGTADEGSRFKVHRHVASIKNWHLTGTGDSRAKALDNLRSSFGAVRLNKKKKGEPLPRPGMQVPIAFASQERVKQHPELADDFIHRVLGLEWAWISDESSLWEFHAGETNEALIGRIKEMYGLDVSDLESAKLWEIFERIATEREPG